MTPLQYCKDRVAQPGSTLYYSLLYLPAGNQDALCALFAFRDELMALLESSLNDDVSTKKLAWWFDEVEHFSRGQPRHPVMRALKDSVCTSAQAVTSNLLTTLANGHSSNQGEAQTHFAIHSGSAIALAAARHCGYTSQTNEDLIHDLGFACAMSERLKLGKTSDLQYLKHAMSVLEHAFTTIAHPDRYNLLGLLTLAAINLAILKRAALGREQTTLARDITPLSKLWIAWKTERSERKLLRKHTT